MDGSRSRRSRLRQTVIFCLPFYKRCDTRTAILYHYLCQGAHPRPGNIRCRFFLQVWYGKSCEINTYMTNYLRHFPWLNHSEKSECLYEFINFRLLVRMCGYSIWRLADTRNKSECRIQIRTNELPITSSDCVYLMVTPSEILGKIRVPGKSFPPLQGDSCYRTMQIEMTCNISRWLRKSFCFNL